MSESFTKLFSSIVDSTIWAEDDATRIVWVTMLAMADRNGYVGASVPGLAARARKTIPETMAALEKFLAPDAYSRSKEFDGRRIEIVERGWLLLNYHTFRERQDDEARREYERIRKRDQRAKGRRPELSGTVPEGPALSAQAEAEADREADAESDAPAPGPDVWAPHGWARRYGRAWCVRYQQIAYGQAGDSKGCSALGEILERLPESERLAAQAIAPQMFAEFLGRGGLALERRHPFSFFVQEWGGLRVPAAPPPKDARAPSYRKL